MTDRAGLVRYHRAMYTPPAYEESDVPTLHALMRKYSFATLVTHHDGTPLVSHLPFLLDTAQGPNGTLVAHMARANDHWRAFEGATPSLVIFNGPHAYISPNWYANRQAVPTWNYAVVHAYGTPCLVTDETRVRDVLAQLATVHESSQAKPWTLADAGGNLDALLKGIVAFEMPIDRLEGKFKFSQRSPRADREGVIRALAASPLPDEREVGEIMRRDLEREPPR